MDRKIYTDDVYQIMKMKYPKIWRVVMFNEDISEELRLRDLYTLFESVCEGTLMKMEKGLRLV